MRVVKISSESTVIELSLDEIETIKNGLNEVCNGLSIPSFEIRMNAKKETVRALEKQFVKLFRQMYMPE